MDSSTSGFNYADYPVIVGIDFGTTFSGCCYAFAQNEEVIDIVKWPRQNNHVYPKTPTLSLYRKGSTQLVDWGHGARRQAMKPNSIDFLLLSKFKLYLDEHLQQESLPNSLNVIDVIADYLRVFHTHVCTELLKGFAGNYDQTKFRYCLTVPAMWSDRAKAAMREAAIRANLIQRSDHPERLMLISEPEAAALYCEKKSEQFNLAHGQRFMICDAGGGTVDLIVFEIDQQTTGRRTLKEVTNGHGGSCGSGFLDLRMRDYIKRKFHHLGSINDSAMEHIMDTFVNIIKPEFDGYEDHFLDLPASMGLGDLTDEDIGLENGSLCLPAHELRDQVFEPVIVQVLELIEGQLSQSPNLEAIFLVGGFGQSNYLFRRVEEVFANRVGMIGVPPRGELAVVRGAVYFGLNPQIVTERVSRRTYGVETRMLFQQDIDPEEYSVVGVDQKKYCRQRFSVYVHKGQSVKVDECISKNFVISYPNDTDSDLFAFDGEGPPPRLTTHSFIKKVGHFPIRMPTLEGVRPGDKVNMTIKMYFGLTEIKIECTIRDKMFVFTSAFDASDSYTGVNNDYPEYSTQPPQGAGGIPYGVQDSVMNSSQLSHAYPPSTYGHSMSTASLQQSYLQQQQPQQQQQQQPPVSSGYPPSIIGAPPSYHTQTSTGYPPQTQPPEYYQQQQNMYSQQGYPPTSQSYYPGYPPASQAYPPPSGQSSGYGSSNYGPH
ncbi:Heat shock 70 kDa protein 12A [Apophysomyces sp. BC1034]|nr:Heat shock 70 kDa protein 12A [Apophysomyces sp. BC1015]KAG0182268.1 Heat shock 70 kDa protein 12A [Apophysomyces sp. BC1021]KAG0192887.1 Heat shock 70 kDa protein 12A [Apophysomyces sp. BC1034]